MSSFVWRSQRPRLAVTTVVNREHAALLAQVDGLSVSTWPPDVHVAVAASDRELARNRLPIRSDRWETVVPRLPVYRHTPGAAFAAAVMLAADAAVQAGVQVIVHLDVRCVPDPELLQTYAEWAMDAPWAVPVLWHAAQAVQLAAPEGVGYPVARELSKLAVRGPVTVPRGPTSGPALPCTDSFAIRAEHWPAVRDAWSMMASGEGAVATLGHNTGSLADAVTVAGGRCVAIDGTVVYRQHPRMADARYATNVDNLPTYAARVVDSHHERRPA